SRTGWGLSALLAWITVLTGADSGIAATNQWRSSCPHRKRAFCSPRARSRRWRSRGQTSRASRTRAEPARMSKNSPRVSERTLIRKPEPAQKGSTRARAPIASNLSVTASISRTHVFGPRTSNARLRDLLDRPAHETVVLPGHGEHRAGERAGEQS